MSATGTSLSEIKDRAIELLREVDGVSVQTYGDPRLRSLAQTIFDLTFKSHYWPDLSEWKTVALDGSTGKPSADLTVVDFDDIRAIYPQNKQRKLPKLPPNINPDTVTGNTPRYIDVLRKPEPLSANKLFRVLPIAATGSVTFYARYHPGSQISTPDDKVLYLDKDMLAFGVVYMTLQQDSTNPGAAEMYQGLYESKMTALAAAYGDIGVPLNNEVDDYPTEWYVA